MIPQKFHQARCQDGCRVTEASNTIGCVWPPLKAGMVIKAVSTTRVPCTIGSGGEIREHRRVLGSRILCRLRRPSGGDTAQVEGRGSATVNCRYQP